MENHLSDTDRLPLTIVIATLGGDQLAETIKHLNSGKLIPDEILIVIPQEESHRVENYSGENILVETTSFRGQVAQRTHGLHKAKNRLVMQMDDDIFINPGDLESLVDSIQKLGPGNAVAPLYGDAESGLCIKVVGSGIKGKLKEWYELLLLGAPLGKAKMGKITAAGTGYGVDKEYCGNTLFEVEWLPGGCVISHREDLVLDEYYPFPGKAFSEDLIQSLHRRKRSIKMWVNPESVATTRILKEKFRWASLWADYRAHRYVVKEIKGQMWRLNIWFLLYVIKRIILFR